MGPDGSLGTVAGENVAGADVIFPNGFKREVKCVAGGYNSFNRDASHAARQLSDASGHFSGEVLIQVKAGTDVSTWASQFARGRQTADARAKYKDVSLRIVDDEGKQLYHGPLAPPPKEAAPAPKKD